MLQGGSKASDERSSGQQHRKRQRRLADSQGGSPQPVPTPGRSSDVAAQGASDAAQRTRNRGHGSIPSLGGGLRIFRSALAADGPPLRENGHTSRPGRGVSSGNRNGMGPSSGGADGSPSTKDLKLLRERALAAHAAAKP